MEGAWRKAKKALSVSLCVHLPAVNGDREDGASERRSSDALSLDSSLAPLVSAPSTPAVTTAAESGALRRSKSGGKSSKRMCAICFDSMKPGQGQALFTAECSHMFHFHCISSSVKHGNHVCPVCRAKWKEIPFNRSLSSIVPRGRGGLNVNDARLPQQDAYMALLRQVPNRQREAPVMHTSEPVDFNDDEPLQKMEAADSCDVGSSRTVEIKTYPEFSAIPQSSSLDDFAVLVHLKAPCANPEQINGRHVNATSTGYPTTRAPVDLVTVLDVSGSMAGTKLALLKRAMGFVIQHLGPSDRLSVIAFSSTARRLFPLRRMSHSGRQQALQAVNSLGASGGTNISDALKKAAKTTLLKVTSAYRDPLTNEAIMIKSDEVKILRPKSSTSEPVCMEVDRERNRLRAADAIETARAAAERGALSDAVAILEDCRKVLSESFSSRSGDRLCAALDAELREMQERMANRQRYEASGRAYLLSGLSSHSWQRATARGDSTDSATLVYSYQTPSMVQMLQRSQNRHPSPQSSSQGQQPRFFLAKPQPR
ncbi:hypothetical protein PR202_gb09091 [Eleusine coracana subsp. coracana]|uniref:Uncharacterized protein n=1 Tax=Eleusine coracana subsp. coracana TaxID=191504 RepID=A0AAV5EGP7_ELECO|nr:hypothetical protein PR202_gb09091 [Eleusine coracana subsp. coracana]